MWGALFLAVFLFSGLSTIGIIITVLTGGFGWGGAHFVHLLAGIVSIFILISLRKFPRIKQQANEGQNLASINLKLFLLLLAGLIPAILAFNLNFLWCIEAAVRGIALIPGKCLFW